MRIWFIDIRDVPSHLLVMLRRPLFHFESGTDDSAHAACRLALRARTHDQIINYLKQKQKSYKRTSPSLLLER